MKLVFALASFLVLSQYAFAQPSEGVCEGSAKQAVMTELVRLGEEAEISAGKLEIGKPALTRLDSSALRIIYNVRVSKVRDPLAIGFTVFRDFEVSLYAGNCGNAAVKLLSDVQ